MDKQSNSIGTKEMSKKYKSRTINFYCNLTATLLQPEMEVIENIGNIDPFTPIYGTS
jgi:hypothetical protein